MKRLLLGLLLTLFSSYALAQGTQLCYTSNGTNCLPGVQASLSTPINIASGTTTQLVALDVNRSIYVTHWDVMAGGTGTFKLVYGTGTNCATGATDLTGAYPLIAQAGISAGSGTGPVILVPKGKALCATTSAAVQYSGVVSYVKF